MYDNIQYFLNLYHIVSGCDKGYTGQNCEDMCPLPTYDVNCQSIWYTLRNKTLTPPQSVANITSKFQINITNKWNKIYVLSISVHYNWNI